MKFKGGSAPWAKDEVKWLKIDKTYATKPINVYERGNLIQVGEGIEQIGWT